jgi:hypothetical protein
MKPILPLLAALICLNVAVQAQTPTNNGTPAPTNSASLDSLLQEYQPLAAYFLDKQGWDGPNFLVLSDSDQSKFTTLLHLANQLAACPAAHDVITQLLSSYKDHDGYTRVALYIALRDTDYTKKYLLYLKQLFLISLKCKGSDYPNHFHAWISPEFFTSLIATRVAHVADTLNGSPFISGASRDLLNTNPIAWINQQIPDDTKPDSEKQ